MSRRTPLLRVLALGLALVLTAMVPHSAGAAAKQRSAVSASLSRASVTTGARVVIAGQVAPHRRRTVAIQRYVGRRWVQVARGGTLADGRYTSTVAATVAGSFSYRAYLLPDRRGRAAVSRSLTVRVAAPEPGGAPRASAGACSFLMGERYRWDPCTPITYVVYPNGAPAGWTTDVAGALQRITAVAGLQFRSLGTTAVMPPSGGSTAAKLVIAYVRPGQSELITAADGRAGVAGKAGATGTSVNTATGVQKQLVEGHVALNLEVIKGLAGGFGSGNATGSLGTRGQLVMHELAHAVGLGHVNDTSQIMYPTMGRKDAVWGAGDVAGLTSVGARSGCITARAPSYGRLLPTERRIEIRD